MPIKQIKNSGITPDQITEFYKTLSHPTRFTGGQKRPYASQVGLCSRMSTIQGLQPSTQVDMGRSMGYYAEIGNAMERVVVNEYKAAGVVMAEDYKIPTQYFDGFDIGGKIDVVLLINDIPIIMDIKSTGNVSNLQTIKFTSTEINLATQNDMKVAEFVNDLEYNKTTFSPVNHAYIAQVQVYCAITGVEMGVLQYFSRQVQDEFNIYDSTPSVYTYAVDTSREILTRRVANIYYSIACRDSKVIGLKSKNTIKTHCNQLYCHFKEFCWNEGKSPVDFPIISDEKHNEFWKQALEKSNIYMDNKENRFAYFMDEMTLSHRLLNKKKKR